MKLIASDATLYKNTKILVNGIELPVNNVEVKIRKRQPVYLMAETLVLEDRYAEVFADMKVVDDIAGSWVSLFKMVLDDHVLHARGVTITEGWDSCRSPEDYIDTFGVAPAQWPEEGGRRVRFKIVRITSIPDTKSENIAYYKPQTPSKS